MTADHSLTEDAGDDSPLGKLYDLDGHVLLLGVDHWNNTSLHLIEYRTNDPGKIYLSTGSVIMVDGKRQWVSLMDWKAPQTTSVRLEMHSPRLTISKFIK